MARRSHEGAIACTPAAEEPHACDSTPLPGRAALNDYREQ
jgi:hypothetical protein